MNRLLHADRGARRQQDERGAAHHDGYDAVQAGAVGCAVGRNIWGAADPTKMTAALAAVIHGGASVAEAMKLLA